MTTASLELSPFRNMFGTNEMRKIFSEDFQVRCYLEVEAALARAQATVGVIPEQVAQRINDAAHALEVDMPRLQRETEIVGYPILSLVKQLAEASGDAGDYVHWGATTQDIMDTATVLQVRKALELIEADLCQLRQNLLRLAQSHRDTPMAGRTHLQQALPITFGYKAAVWLSSVERHISRLEELRPRVLVGSLGGAAGTLASLGDHGFEVLGAFCRELDVGEPIATWHVARDGIAETVTLLGLITGTLAKIATDVALMASTEFGELSEPFVDGRGASSTMPQKSNPISCELILAASKAVRQNVGLALDGMVHDFERATGAWHLEWLALPDSFVLTAGACEQANFMLKGLVIYPERMRANLDLTSGLIVAEAVMMALARKLGRQNAHEIVYKACRAAVAQDLSLVEALEDDEDIVAALGGHDALQSLCDPTRYLGLSARMVDRVVAGRDVRTPAAADHCKN